MLGRVMPGLDDGDDGGVVGELEGFGDTGAVVRGGVGGTVRGGVVRRVGAVVGCTGAAAGAEVMEVMEVTAAGPLVRAATGTATYRRRVDTGTTGADPGAAAVVGAAVDRRASGGDGRRDVSSAAGAGPVPLPSAELEPENGLLPLASTIMARAQVTAKTIRLATVRTCLRDHAVSA
jgi:hypothetical protein